MLAAHRADSALYSQSTACWKKYCCCCHLLSRKRTVKRHCHLSTLCSGWLHEKLVECLRSRCYVWEGDDPSQVVLRDGFSFTLLGCGKNKWLTWLTKKKNPKKTKTASTTICIIYLSAPLEWKSSEMLVVSRLKRLSNWWSCVCFWWFFLKVIFFPFFVLFYHYYTLSLVSGIRFKCVIRILARMKGKVSENGSEISTVCMV